MIEYKASMSKDFDGNEISEYLLSQKPEFAMIKWP